MVGVELTKNDVPIIALDYVYNLVYKSAVRNIQHDFFKTRD